MDQKTPPIRVLAEAIASDLFTSGGGQRAERLALIDAEKRDLGGWGLEPATDRIERMIRRWLILGETNG